MLVDEKRTPSYVAARLSSADAKSIVKRAMEDCQVSYFYTANVNMVAACVFKVFEFTPLIAP